MDELAHRTVAKIFGGSDPGTARNSEQAMLANYMQRKQSGQWADLMARHSVGEMDSYFQAMEKLATTMGGG